MCKIQEVENTDNILIKKLEGSYNDKIQAIDNRYTKLTNDINYKLTAITTLNTLNTQNKVRLNNEKNS